jgi:hypothetical protein
MESCYGAGPRNTPWGASWPLDDPMTEEDRGMWADWNKRFGTRGGIPLPRPAPTRTGSETKSEESIP